MGYHAPTADLPVLYEVYKITKFRKSIHHLSDEEQIKACWKWASKLFPHFFGPGVEMQGDQPSNQKKMLEFCESLYTTYSAILIFKPGIVCC